MDRQKGDIEPLIFLNKESGLKTGLREIGWDVMLWIDLEWGIL
jgi:hypothetical protein